MQGIDKLEIELQVKLRDALKKSEDKIARRPAFQADSIDYH